MFQFSLRRSFASMLLALGLLLSPCAARQDNSRQDNRRVPEDVEPVKLGATFVQVPVIVKGTGGLYMTDLMKSDFKLFEDGVQQQIEFFGAIEERFNVALVIDSSGSTSEQLAMIKAAANAFINNLRSHDRVMVIAFSDSVEALCGLTSDREVLRDAVASIRPGEFTQVYEAVYTAVWEKLYDVEGRKAVIIFTDGIDTSSSEISQEDTLDAVVEMEDIIVYPIRYSTREDVERRLEARRGPAAAFKEEGRRELDRAYRRADEYLYRLAELSGGRVERADTLGDLDGAFARIADELRHQYLLGYYTTNDHKDDRTRRIRVEVSRAGAKVRARPGYKVVN